MAAGTYHGGPSGGPAQYWAAEVWARDVDMAPYEEGVMTPLVLEHEAGMGKLHWPKHDNLASADIADGGNPESLTYVSNTETEATFTPTLSYCASRVSLPMYERMVTNPESVLRKSTNASLVQRIDVKLFSLVAAHVVNIVGANTDQITKGTILDARQKLLQGAKSEAKADQEFNFIVGVTEDDDLLNISDITNAQIRGGSETPMVSGWIAKALGFRFYESGNVQSSGASLFNVAFAKRAYVISWNNRPKLEIQPFDLSKKIIAWSDYLYGTLREQRTCQVLTKAA